jgi:hypothetical protein
MEQSKAEGRVKALKPAIDARAYITRTLMQGRLVSCDLASLSQASVLSLRLEGSQSRCFFVERRLTSGGCAEDQVLGGFHSGHGPWLRDRHRRSPVDSLELLT